MMKFKKIPLKNLFENNTFVFTFSIFCAVLVWFYMASNNSLGKPKYVYDVPITINLSETAQAEGVQVFDQNITTARVSITGSSFLINQVTADDLQIIATLSPVVNKITGNTTITETLTLTALKAGNDLADYQVIAVEPDTIEIVYDRYKEVTYDIVNNIDYTVSEDYYASSSVLADTYVVISGPESSIAKIATVAIDYTISEPLMESQSLDLPITLYDEDGNVLNVNNLYLTLSIESANVQITVESKQTVELQCTILNLPTDFTESRISIEPATIEIAGDYDTVSQYKTITLTDAIDFTNINTTDNVFQIEIPMPQNVTNVSNISTATVTVDMSGYSETILSTSEIQFSNIPDDKEVTLVTQSLEATIIGTNAQVSKLSEESLYATVDMAGLTDVNGDKEVSVRVAISGSSSCWVYGQYTIYVNVSDKVLEVDADLEDASE